MGYSLSGGYTSCWKCGGHNVVHVLSVLLHKETRECRQLLDGVDKRPGKEITPRGTLVLPKGLGPLLDCHRRYLEDRGFDGAELAERWRIQGLGQSGAVTTPAGKRIGLSWRIFIPIHYHGEVVSWTTRSISPDAELRYISAPADCEAMNHKELLFGADFCGHAAVVVEGPFDVMRIGPGCVGTCGTGFSRAQVLKLSGYLQRGVCFDSEPEAQKRARTLMRELSVFPGSTINIVLDSKDPGEASDEEIQALRKEMQL
jgi:hypothetical protein